MSTLSIVIPLYKSHDLIPKLISKLELLQVKKELQLEFVFVDDGNEKSMLELIENTELKTPYRYIRLAKNYGQHTATAVGLAACDSDYIVTIDDDLQHDPEEIEKLLQKSIETDADLVYGTYVQKSHSKAKNLGSKLLKLLLKNNNQNYSEVTSFRLMKGHLANQFKGRNKKLIFIDEFLLEQANKVESASVSHHKRPDNLSSYSYAKLFQFAVKILLYHSSFPLKLVVRVGIFTAIICFILGCYFIYQKLVYDSQMGFSALIVSIFFSTGLILITLGIIGEYIRRLWIEQQKLNTVTIAFDSKNK